MMRGPWLPAAALAGLVVLAAGGAAGQPGGLYLPAAASAAPTSRDASDALTLRSWLVSIDFGRLAPPAGASFAGAAAVAAPSGVRLNLFADAPFTGLVERVEPMERDPRGRVKAAVSAGGTARPVRRRRRRRRRSTGGSRGRPRGRCRSRRRRGRRGPGA